jgi:hypothetical protein
MGNEKETDKGRRKNKERMLKEQKYTKGRKQGRVSTTLTLRHFILLLPNARYIGRALFCNLIGAKCLLVQFN